MASTEPSAPAQPSAPAIDQMRAGEFLESMKATYRGAVLTMMIDLGQRTGLFDALAQHAGSSAELAERTGLSERHVREWLGAVSVAGIVEYQPAMGDAAAVFTLPPEHAMWLTGTGYTNMAPMSAMLTGLGQRLDDVDATFRNGGGVPYEKYRPHFTCAMDSLGRAKYDALLVPIYLPKVRGLTDRLRDGVRVGDVGCGTGHCLNLMAAAFPNSVFEGFDFSHEAIELARTESAAMGLNNVTFHVVDAALLPSGFDVVFAFDAIHDQSDPTGVLRAIRASLSDDGIFVMLDIKASSDLADNISNPLTLMLYGISVMHCMQVSLAGGGPGLGTVWGTQLATAMLNDAGFSSVTIHDLQGDPTNCIYDCRIDPLTPEMGRV
jgi:SAM-dependent methyltransferase